MRRQNPRIHKTLYVLAVLLVGYTMTAHSQSISDSAIRHIDSILPPKPVDTLLRIRNLNPFFNLHVDSTLSYNLEINRDETKYYYYLRNSPAGLKINKDEGVLSFKADKALFLSGKLKYDNEYRVAIGVQSLDDPKDKIDTFFSMIFYNTEIIPSRVKPTVSSTLTIDEGDTVSFRVLCENGSFPIEKISFFANTPLKNATIVRNCDDEFLWSAPFEFVKDTDSGRVKIINLTFIGANRFNVRDTAIVKLIVRDALNYPLAMQDYNLVTKNIKTYIFQLKNTFKQLDKGVKKTKGTRTTFDITSSTTALTGSVLSASDDPATRKAGVILPSVGVSLVPIKEAVAPQKVFDQNQAAQIRTSIKRLDYMLGENSVVGEKDPDIAKKTTKLRDELRQTQVQLIDIPLEEDTNVTEEELNQYFTSPKVNKKYRVKK
jgi:hypothetical protein